MNKKEIKKLVDDYPVLKGHSQKSREKIADSYMTISNNLWSVVFVSVIALPLGGVFNSLFSEKPLKPSFEILKTNMDSYFWILSILLILATGLALLFRRSALRIYDSITN
jgi:hypothetical protein